MDLHRVQFCTVLVICDTTDYRNATVSMLQIPTERSRPPVVMTVLVTVCVVRVLTVADKITVIRVVVVVVAEEGPCTTAAEALPVVTAVSVEQAQKVVKETVYRLLLLSMNIRVFFVFVFYSTAVMLPLLSL
jgi:hypothetical protein